MIHGIINVYKEKGYTSHDVVAKLRGIAGQKKIGHTGTLDPDAEGVLPVCLGKATKVCDLLTDKDNAGAALLEAFKEVKDSEPVPVGSYRGFQTALTAEGFYMDCILTLKGQMSHRVELGKDARGNLTRIDNVLNAIPARLNSQKVYLENLYAQMEAAKTELGKPFPQEEELRVKSARLAELNAELNIDDKMQMERLAGDTEAVAKSTRPSILQKLRAPLPEQTNLKPKHKEMEVSR